MSKKKTNKQKRLTSQPAGTKFLCARWQPIEVQMVHINHTMQIKENSP